MSIHRIPALVHRHRACRCYTRRMHTTDGKNEEDGRKDVSHKYARRSWNVGRGAAREEEFPVANERWDASAAALFASQVRATRASTN